VTRKRIAVLGSGGGSNFESIAIHLQAQGARAAGEIVVVASDRPRAGLLVRAAARSIPAVSLRGSADGGELIHLLAGHGVDLVVLAGYLRMVPGSVVERFAGRMLNVHPALLPQFGGAGMYGDRVHRAVLDSGATVTGVTVHLVSDEYDRGEILAQWPVPVLADDTVRSLAARVLSVEHVIYPAVIAAVAAGTAGAGRPCRFTPPVDGEGVVFLTGPGNRELLRASIDLLTDAAAQQDEYTNNYGND
jgi:phosphoribosylglycinamide formyltransferase-1